VWAWASGWTRIAAAEADGAERMHHNPLISMPSAAALFRHNTCCVHSDNLPAAGGTSIKHPPTTHTPALSPGECRREVLGALPQKAHPGPLPGAGRALHRRCGGHHARQEARDLPGGLQWAAGAAGGAGAGGRGPPESRGEGRGGWGRWVGGWVGECRGGGGSGRGQAKQCDVSTLCTTPARACTLATPYISFIHTHQGTHYGHPHTTTPQHQALERYHGEVVSQLPPSECELLYGRAGYLWALRWTEGRLGGGTISKQVVKVRRWAPGGGVVSTAHAYHTIPYHTIPCHTIPYHTIP
jgi:hypothetical protein